ncbi:succinylglutamate desuccinylase [Hwanghaeella grinnelliae]|uniref:Succinylglutamate desuccinylase n=1 Tax=Hwanghaeella grinnelliae TaxID=2500179 RepID=A0A3S2Z9M4_9PROT|nr:succinylglutamate desuccinylase/aspartoacylase family protein [Hwanghaeella grinnelliae]RVU38674.1 succinylglutamate desuccinylase [Hwanghaeella grinnelliae]
MSSKQSGSSEVQVDLTAPDLSPYRQGNTGVDYYHRFDSGQAGPTVMVNALTHGNEICGAIALDRLFKSGFRPARGSLLLGFANIAAYENFDPMNPGQSRYVDEDFNRLWSADVLDGPRQSLELTRARKIRPLIDETDLLLDIHSMSGNSPAMMLAGPLNKGVDFAKAVGYPGTTIIDSGHAAGVRLRDYRDFGDPSSKRNALLVECGQHWHRQTGDMAWTVLLAFLHATKLADSAFLDAQGFSAPPSDQKVVRVTDVVTVSSDSFTFSKPFQGMERIEKAGTVIGRDGSADVTTPYDDCALVMPSHAARKGQTAVRLGRVMP